VLVIRHAGKDGKGRGSSQFEAEVDIVATLKRPEGNHADTVRQLETIGRYGATKLNMELTEEGYVPLGSDEKVAFTKAVKTIKGVLPRRKENAIPEDRLVEKAKGEVSKGTLIRALRWLVDQGSVVREGLGKRGSPYTYWLPPKDAEPDDSFSPNSHSLGGEKEKAEIREGGTGSSGSYELVTDPERLAEVAAFLEGATEVALDLETTGLDPRKDRIRLLSLATEEKTWLVDGCLVDVRGIFEALEDKILVVHNAMHDLLFLRHLGYTHRGRAVDTMTFSRMVHAGERDAKDKRLEHSLEACCERELGVELDKSHQKADWAGDLSEEMLSYAAEDARVLLPLRKALEERIFASGQERALEIEERARLAGI